MVDGLNEAEKRFMAEGYRVRDKIALVSNKSKWVRFKEWFRRERIRLMDVFDLARYIRRIFHKGATKFLVRTGLGYSRDGCRMDSYREESMMRAQDDPPNQPLNSKTEANCRAEAIELDRDLLGLMEWIGDTDLFLSDEEYRQDFEYKGKTMGEFLSALCETIKPIYHENDLGLIALFYDLLSSYLNIPSPKVEYGDPKKNGKDVLGLYHPNEHKIELRCPSKFGTVLHEFFHHINNVDESWALQRIMRLFLAGLFFLPPDMKLEQFGGLIERTKWLLEEAKRRLELMRNTRPLL